MADGSFVDDMIGTFPFVPREVREESIVGYFDTSEDYSGTCEGLGAEIDYSEKTVRLFLVPPESGRRLKDMSADELVDGDSLLTLTYTQSKWGNLVRSLGTYESIRDNLNKQSVETMRGIYEAKTGQSGEDQHGPMGLIRKFTTGKGRKTRKTRRRKHA